MKKIITIGFLSLLLGNPNVYGEGILDENVDSNKELEYKSLNSEENLDSTLYLNSDKVLKYENLDLDKTPDLNKKSDSASDEKPDSNENLAYHDGYPFSHWAVGINAGLYGYGLEVNTHLIPNIKLRLGFNYFRYTFGGLKYEYDIKDEFGHKTGEEGMADLIPKIEFANGKVLFDILPFKTGKFAFTAGVYIGKNGLTVNGKTTDKNSGLPTSAPIYFDDDDIVIYPDSKGNVAATLRMGNIVKPYFGFTFGRAIPRHRIGFKYEMGIIYQGKLKLESNSTNNSATNRANDEFNSGMNGLSSTIQTLLKVWPMMQFQLTYKIK